MKKSFFISAIAIGVYYLIKYLGKEEESLSTTPRQKHLTNVFSKAKEHALAAQ
jgi:hypothetical protein